MIDLDEFTELKQGLVVLTLLNMWFSFDMFVTAKNVYLNELGRCLLVYFISILIYLLNVRLTKKRIVYLQAFLVFLFAGFLSVFLITDVTLTMTQVDRLLLVFQFLLFAFHSLMLWVDYKIKGPVTPKGIDVMKCSNILKREHRMAAYSRVYFD